MTTTAAEVVDHLARILVHRAERAPAHVLRVAVTGITASGKSTLALALTRRLEDMGQLYSLVAADLRTLYTIEYQPTNDKRDGRWRAIKVDVDRPELISRTRQGYFAK